MDWYLGITREKEYADNNQQLLLITTMRKIEYSTLENGM